MKIVSLLSVFIIGFSIYAFCYYKESAPICIDEDFLTYEVDAQTQNLKLYLKNETDSIMQTFENLNTFVEQNNQTLVFAMNAGMFNKDYSPKGLYIEDYKTICPIDTSSGEDNFYLKPNGIFYINNKNVPNVCCTQDFVNNGDVKYATQSGPMLLIDGKIHSAFREGSANLYVRNGVGILPNGKIIFVMSKSEINFYDFATYFKNLGCKNALYLDGYVSRSYLPEKNWVQNDGNFGVMIGVTVGKN